MWKIQTTEGVVRVVQKFYRRPRTYFQEIDQEDMDLSLLSSGSFVNTEDFPINRIRY
jgi:hypothetical protein